MSDYYEFSLSLLDDNDYVDKTFLVDKGHKDGKELHCVTNSGLIFIFNQKKFETNQNSLITLLIARQNQIKRLYEECNLEVPQYTMNRANLHYQLEYNRR